jgi:hypothetical protein
MSCGLGRDNGDPVQRAFYTPREAERILLVSHATLYRLISKGLLDARKLGDKTLITAVSLEQLIDKLPRAQVRQPAALDGVVPRGRGRPRKAAPVATPPTAG